MKKADVERLNINIGGVPALGYLGSSEAFDNLSKYFGHRIPDGYREFLRIADGGHPEIGSYSLQDGGELEFDVDWFYSLGNYEIETIESVIAGWGPTLGEGALPIGRDGSGNQIYLNFSDHPPSVYLYLHDGLGSREKIASSFESFIDKLQFNPDFI